MNLIYSKNEQGKIDFISTIKRSYCRAWALSSQQFFLRYYPWLIWPRWVGAADLGWWPFHPLEFWTRCLFGLSRLKKKRSIEYSLLVPPFPPPPSFAMFLSLKATLILYAKGDESGLQNNVSWLKSIMCPSTHTLFQCKPREVISHFNSLLPLVVTAKSVKVYGRWKIFLPASTQVSNCYCWLQIIFSLLISRRCLEMPDVTCEQRQGLFFTLRKFFTEITS